MATAELTASPAWLESGDCLPREEFHRIYERMPEHVRAELIGGVVYVASPLRRAHGRPHVSLSMLFGYYEAHTPGTEASDNTSIILGDDSEPQPDLYLLVQPEFGGQSSITDDDYVLGAPELVAEIAHSSQAIDLNAKRHDYARYGVREYLVYSVHDRQLRWFDLVDDVERNVADGVVCSTEFPGLWIDVPALIRRDHDQLLHVLEQGLASDEHATFVRTLSARKTDH